MTAADLIVLNANVITMDDARPVARGFAVRNGLIVAVGSDADASAYAGPRTQIIDLEGRTILPGLIDGHAHIDREALRTWYPSLAGCRSIADVQAVVAGCVSVHGPGEWIVTAPLGVPPYHLDPGGTLAERRFPTRDDLDCISPANPVWIRAIWGHWADGPPFVHVLNSAALAAAGIDEATSPPSSSVEIERDPAGRLTGRVLEHRITPVVEHTLLRMAPLFTPEIREAALERSIAIAHAGGMTGVYEGHGIAPDVEGAYRRLHARNALRLRTTMAVSLGPWSSLDAARTLLENAAARAAHPGTGDARLLTDGVYLEFGGDPENAALSARAWPYTGWAGFLAHAIDQDSYRELCIVAARHGLRVNTTIGLTLDVVLKIWEDVHAQYPIDRFRWTLIHARETIPERDFPRILRLGAIVTTQPSTYAHRAGAPNVDESRIKAHRDYVDAGIPWALSSDNKPSDLRQTIAAAVTRRERMHGRLIGPGQAVTVFEAFRALTTSAAYLCGRETSLGTLSASKFADAVVFDRDPFLADPAELSSLPIALTLFDGSVVYDPNDVAKRRAG